MNSAVATGTSSNVCYCLREQAYIKAEQVFGKPFPPLAERQETSPSAVIVAYHSVCNATCNVKPVSMSRSC